MDIDWMWIILLFAIGFIGSFISGMVGIGGSIIKYPMLLYIPPALGFVSLTAQEVAAVSAIQVFFATLVGMLAYRNGSLINLRLVVTMGIPIVIGSFLGGYGSRWLPDSTINITYAVMALVASVMMFLPKRGDEEGNYAGLTFNRTLAAGTAAVVGLLSGVVGAAGAFITVPIMLVLLRIPTRVAIASSLAITFMASIGTTAGKISPYATTTMMSALSVRNSSCASALRNVSG